MNKSKEISERLNAITSRDNNSMTTKTKTLLGNEKYIMSKLDEDIKFPKPILHLSGEGLIYPNTINLIQGKSGVHKSRLEGHIISCLLAKDKDINIANFTRNRNKQFNVVVIDTERSISDLLPYSIQTILEHAGYDKSAPPKNFRVTSMANISRSNRLNDLKVYLDEVKSNAHQNAHNVVFLDVVTDLIDDFNNIVSSFELVDYLNQLINDYNLTFIAVIHENPGSEKSRGHSGTELNNKSSTVIQISGNKDGASKTASTFQLSVLKTRYSAPVRDHYYTYDSIKKALVELNHEIGEAMFSRKKEKKADEADIIEAICGHYQMDIWYKKQEWFNYLIKEFNCSDKTLKMRIDELINHSPHEGISILTKREGRETLYKIESQRKIMEEKKDPI